MIGDSQDEGLLGAVASALVAIDELQNLTMFQMPYPSSVQRALDKIVLHCLYQGALPPGSVAALVRWGYERPLGTWPLMLDTGIYPVDGFLIDEESGSPTELCHEIALCAETDNPLWEASHRMATLAALATERGQDSTFGTMRSVLAKHPMLTNELFNAVRFANNLGALEKRLGEFYQKIGPEYEVDGAVFPCAHCGTPLLPTDAGSWWCEREECSAGGPVSPDDPVDWDAKVSIQTDRRHRQFVSGPGRAVLRIASSLALPRVTVRLWPAQSPGDLRVKVADVLKWTAAIVDWHNPALLGRAIAATTAWSGTDTAIWVVAQYRVDADPAYLQLVRKYGTTAAGSPRVCSEEEFTSMVRRHSEESGRA
ncbi:HU-CCDC81 and SPOR domain-containing protein [Frankia sp. QA3]|uniref:pPIWI_RE_Y domain-containing protein n=1 Tax=Frankia sp. QA3 TaxID=710111 RepID=UPI000269BDA7|nr:HU-CCDC81 and SPOR domain-containing protein [Frankia sp. QA3]EIV91823.1 hypothetical protein FraQA3DRAFT_1303 [Frankia sp. QA3]